MGTPSEVAAGIILEELGFKNIKFVDKSFDYIATDSVIEVKADHILRLKQMQALAQKAALGRDSYLLVVSKEGDYCLFKLVSTNLISMPLKAASPKELEIPKPITSISELVPKEIREEIRTWVLDLRRRKERTR